MKIGGRTAWVRFSTAHLCDVFHDGDGRVWLAGAKGTVLCSEDGGKRWSARDPAAKNPAAVSSVWASGALVIAADEGGAIWRSQDGGKRYQQVRKGHDGIARIARGSGSRVHAVGYNGLALVSGDLGKTFRERGAGGAPALLDVCVAGDTLWAAGFQRLLRAPEASREAYTAGGPTCEPIAVAAGGEALWVLHERGVYRSLDRGASWEVALAREVIARGLWAGGPTEAVIVGHRGAIWHCTG